MIDLRDEDAADHLRRAVIGRPAYITEVRPTSSVPSEYTDPDMPGVQESSSDANSDRARAHGATGNFPVRPRATTTADSTPARRPTSLGATPAGAPLGTPTVGEPFRTPAQGRGTTTAVSSVKVEAPPKVEALRCYIPL